MTMTWTPEEILGWRSEKIQAWLATMPSDREFPWLTLGESAAMAANSTSQDVLPTRRDALGDLAVYALHKATEQEPSTRNGALLSEIVVRSGLIHRLGERAGSIRDPLALWLLLDDVFERANTIRHHVADGPVDLTRISVEEMLLLRRVKSALRSAKLVLESDLVSRPSSVDWWWSRRQHLP